MECRCASCGRRFRPNSRVKEQRYCGDPACQRERRRRWKWDKRQVDADYRLNQAVAQRAWAEAHADYWRHWRQQHPDYVERNRLQQRERDRRRRVDDLAKRNASAPVRARHGRLPAKGIADKELSALLRRERLVPVVHGTTYEELEQVSLLLASRAGLSTAEEPLAEVAAKIAELVAI